MAEKQFIARFMNLMKAQQDLIEEMQKLAARELTLVDEMQSLAHDLQDHTNRMRTSHEMFHSPESAAEPHNVTKLPVAETFDIPRVLKGGPNRRDDS